MTLETPYRIEPCLLSNPPAEVVDLIAELSGASERLHQGIHPKTAASLANLVRMMNCYYSNLIEGHNTTPREIEEALRNQLNHLEERRNLQLEAKAHIRIQKLIDEQYLAGTLSEPASADFIRWVHQEFYAEVPAEMLEVEGEGQRITMVPGNFRSRPEEDVSVGRHIPPASQYVESFMNYFENQYTFKNLGQGGRMMAMAAAHHRLNYIHPFPDGNGRVSRLMSHAMGLLAGIGAHGLWSVSRGLARGLESRGDYKRMMDYADTPRQGDLDGRGNLSLKALEDFITWFLKVCLDQVHFMDSLFRLDTLASRLKRYQDIRGWKSEAYPLLETVLLRGEVSRGEVPHITGLKERSARMLLSDLTEDGILSSDTPKGPVHLAFPMDSVDILFPQLFPQA